MLLIFGMTSASLAIYTMTAMQNSAQYAALMVATSKVKNLSTGQITTTNTTATAQCSASIPNTDAEYYACQGLPPWATFTITTTETCGTTPSVAVSISVNASMAAVADVFHIFGNKTLTSNVFVMKEGTCP
jgi:hypothetical protein